MNEMRNGIEKKLYARPNEVEWIKPVLYCNFHSVYKKRKKK